MTKIMTLICERSCDLDAHVDSKSQLKEVEGCYVVKFPCSGMIQPLMIEAALKNGADGVVVTGCQLGDCYYREGNRMIRERLLGDRPPGLKKGIDRRRVIGLWLSKVQPQRLISEVKEFIGELKELPADKPADKPAAAKPAAKPAAPKPEPAAEAKPEAAKAEEKKEEAKPVETPKAEETKTEAPKTEETKTEAPKTEETKTEAPKAEETKTEAPKADEQKSEEAKAEAKEEAKSEEPKSEDK